MLVRRHMTFKLRVFRLWQTNFASYEELTVNAMRGLLLLSTLQTFQLQLLSPSGGLLPPFNGGAITQLIRINNPTRVFSHQLLFA